MVLKYTKETNSTNVQMSKFKTPSKEFVKTARIVLMLLKLIKIPS